MPLLFYVAKTVNIQLLLFKIPSPQWEGKGSVFNKYPNYDLKHKRKILQMEGREPCPAVPYTYIRNKKLLDILFSDANVR